MLERIRSFLTLPFINNTLKLSSSSVLLMLLPLVVTPILSRLYTPVDYSDWGVFASVVQIVNSFLFLSYEHTIVRENEAKNVPSLIVLCLIVSSTIIAIVYLLFSIGCQLDIKFFVDFPSIGLLIAILFIGGLYTLTSNVANREKKYGPMAIANIINGTSQAILRIALGLWPIISFGLIVGNVIAYLIGVTFLIISLFKVLKTYPFKSVTFSDVRQSAIRNKKFAVFDAPARFIEFAIGHLALIVLSLFWAKSEIGCYSMIVQFVLLPISIVGSAMGNVFYRELSENIGNREAIQTATRRAAKITFAISLAPILFLVFGGDILLEKFLGSQWIGSGRMALCMVAYSVPIIMSEPLLPIYRVLDKQEIRFRFNVVNFVLSIGLLIATSFLFKDIYMVVMIYSISYAIVRFLIYRNELKLVGLSFKSVSRYFFLVVIGIYVLLFTRLTI